MVSGSVSAYVRDIAVHLPERVETNDDLAREWPDWDAARFGEKTGIRIRHLASEGQCASDLAFEAARQLFARPDCSPELFDFLIFVTETPDHFTPATSSILQARLGLPTSAGALDMNQACSGYVQGLAVARGLIESGAATNLLLCIGATFSRIIDPTDRAIARESHVECASHRAAATAGDCRKMTYHPDARSPRLDGNPPPPIRITPCRNPIGSASAG